jgi:UDP-N-acetylmuramate dehydrogenase
MEIQHNIQLQPYNSFRTGAVAKLFAQPATVAALQQILARYKSEDKLVIGKGCNLFFTRDFDGLVIKPDISGIQVLKENDDWVEIEAGAAEDWDNFVAFCVSRGFAVVENLSLIPGTVGAAPIQNIGAYGTEVKDVITRVEAVNSVSGNRESFTNAACGFTYRNSIFKETRRFVITSVIFRLQKKFSYVEKYADLKQELQGNPHPSLQEVRDAVIRIRTRKLPDHLKLPNAGSFFKNPVLTELEKDELLKLLPDAPIYRFGNNSYKTSAAYLIEKAGYKGRRKGDVGIYDRHALIVVNYGTGTGSEILDFVREIQQEVQTRFNIGLEPEVWIF